MEKTTTPEDLKIELDKIKNVLFNNTKLLKIAVQRVLDSSAKDLSSNLITLEKALADSKIDEPDFNPPA